MKTFELNIIIHEEILKLESHVFAPMDALNYIYGDLGTINEKLYDPSAKNKQYF